MIPVLFHPQAEAELVAAASWYEGEQTDLGKRFLSSVEDGISRIKGAALHYPLLVLFAITRP